MCRCRCQSDTPPTSDLHISQLRLTDLSFTRTAQTNEANPGSRLMSQSSHAHWGSVDSCAVTFSNQSSRFWSACKKWIKKKTDYFVTVQFSSVKFKGSFNSPFTKAGLWNEMWVEVSLRYIRKKKELFYRVRRIHWEVSQLEDRSCSAVCWCDGKYFCIFCQPAAGWQTVASLSFGPTPAGALIAWNGSGYFQSVKIQFIQRTVTEHNNNMNFSIKVRLICINHNHYMEFCRVEFLWQWAYAWLQVLFSKIIFSHCFWSHLNRFQV